MTVSELQTVLESADPSALVMVDVDDDRVEADAATVVEGGTLVIFIEED